MIWNRWLIVGLVLPALSVALPLSVPVAQAKSYRIEQAYVHAVLEPDGSLHTTEERSFRFSGDFTYAYRQINCTCRDRLSDIVVSDESGVYEQSEEKLPGTYRVFHYDSGARIEWYFRASDTVRTFTLQYRLTHAIRMHRDAATLDWQPIGSEWSVGSRDVKITLELPRPAIDAWLTGGDIPIVVEGNRLRMDDDWISSGKSVAIRVLLPTSAVPHTAFRASNQSAESILKRAGRIDDPVSRVVQIAWLVLVGGYTVWFGRRVLRHTSYSKSEAGRPDPLPPPAIAKFTGQTPLTGFQASVVDLLHRRVLSLAEMPNGDWRVDLDPRLPLDDHEKLAVNLLFLNRRDSVTINEWKVLRSKDPVGFASKVTSWWVRVERAIPRAWIAPYRWDAYLVAATVIPMIIFTPSTPFSLISGLLAGVLVLFGLLQTRKTDEGYRQQAAWRHERWRLVSGEVSSDELAAAVALGIDLNRVAVSDAAELRSLAFFQLGKTYFSGAFTYAHYGGGAGGGCGGGGGAG